MSVRTRSTSVASAGHKQLSNGVVSTAEVHTDNRQKSWQTRTEAEDLLQFAPPAVWIVSDRREPWVQVVAICRDQSAARRLADKHNAGRHPDDNGRWHIEPHPCNVVAHVL
ncbi:hypothetical protein BH09GEM1_BH09GEM1_45390 [soil metagenome]